MTEVLIAGAGQGSTPETSIADGRNADGLGVVLR